MFPIYLQWCVLGHCEVIGESPQAINGQWGVWSPWSKCSRTCGAGVAYSERHCDNPPPSNGGNYCLGERKRYRICNTDDCKEGAVSFRQVQCEEFNTVPYKNRVYEWEAVYTPSKWPNIAICYRFHQLSLIFINNTR